MGQTTRPNIAQLVEHSTVVVCFINIERSSVQFRLFGTLLRVWCSGNMNPFQGFASDSISGTRILFFMILF